LRRAVAYAVAALVNLVLVGAIAVGMMESMPAVVEGGSVDVVLDYVELRRVCGDSGVGGVPVAVKGRSGLVMLVLRGEV